MPTLRNRATAALTVLALVIVAACLAFNQAWKLADVRHKAEALTGGNVAARPVRRSSATAAAAATRSKA